jgi:hypothetical protein
MSKVANIGLMPELPLRPTGWTKRLIMHLNFGSDGGAATYSIWTPDGEEVPIGYQYDTTKGGLTGFTLPNVEGVMTWAELRAKWPDWIKTRGREEEPA